jgi:hypothetical protein
VSTNCITYLQDFTVELLSRLHCYHYFQYTVMWCTPYFSALKLNQGMLIPPNITNLNQATKNISSTRSMILWWTPLTSPPIQSGYFNIQAPQPYIHWHSSCECKWELQSAVSVMQDGSSSTLAVSYRDCTYEEE